MSFQKIYDHFDGLGMADRVLHFDVSSATVELAAAAVGTEPARIAKTISFKLKDQDRAVLIVAAGDAKIDNAKYKALTGCKAVMLTPEQVVEYTGSQIGGVCPFCLPEGRTDVYIDISLKRFDIVYPAAGSSDSAVRLTPEELLRYSGAKGFCDVCKGWQGESGAARRSEQ